MLDEYDEARALLNLFASKYPRHPDVAAHEANFAALAGDYDIALERVLSRLQHIDLVLADVLAYRA